MNIIEKSSVLSSDKFQKSIEYWKSVFTNEFKVISIFPNLTNSINKKLKSESFSINSNNSDMLMDRCNNDISLFTYLYTIHVILVSKLTGANKFCLCLPQLASSGQTYNIALPIPANCHPLDTFKDLLLSNKESIAKTYKNSIYPLDEINDNLRAEFCYKNLVYFSGIHSENSILEIENMSEHEISIQFSQKNGVIFYTFIYNSEKFDLFSIQQLAKLFSFILSQTLDNVNVSIESIKLVEELCLSRDNFENEINQENIVELFEKGVKNYPSNIAVIFPIDLANIYDSFNMTEQRTSMREAKYAFDKLTYQELNEKANRLANYLLKLRVKKNVVVGLMLNPTLEMIISIWAVLKAGGTFLPISPDTPSQRLEFMVSDSGCQAVITHDYLVDQASFFKEIIDIDNINLSKEPSTNVDIKIGADQLAYMIYTSGTTGQPKGVLITHGNIANYSNWFCECYDINQNDKTALLSSYAFDLGYTSLFSSILKGGEIHIIPKNIYTSPTVLIEYINSEKLSYIKLTPSFFSTIVSSLNFSLLANKSFKNIILGGEKININDVNYAYNECKDVVITNHYGPTEATVGCIAYRIKREELDNIDDLNIGYPIKNTNIRIVSPDNQILPDGIPGELCISGNGVSKGYQNQELLTKTKFIHLREEPSQRIYKSGDLARRLPNGSIEFLGRSDRQKKINGYRIELEEIENTILKNEKISGAKVIVSAIKQGEEKLIAFLVLKDSSLGIMQIKKNLSSCLPYYMIPSFITILDKFPLTPNGKIDIKALITNLSATSKIGNTTFSNFETQTQKKLAAIWKELLQVEKVGLNDKFFDLGGNSLLLIKSNQQIKEQLGVELPFDYYLNMTLKQFADKISEQ